MVNTFNDLFSNNSANYQQYRPGYPWELFIFLSQLVKNHNLAWDCGTGNGQAAIRLAHFFYSVIATDASQEQINNAILHKSIQYYAAKAEDSNIDKRSVDLITVAQSAHWFDLNAFYHEAKRVLKKDGIIALWCYGLIRITPEIDTVISHLYQDILGDYWPEQRRLIDQNYQTIPFPFSEVGAPHIEMTSTWSLSHLINYLGTWSAVGLYKTKHGQDPVALVVDELTRVWHQIFTKPECYSAKVSWPVSIRVGKFLP